MSPMRIGSISLSIPCVVVPGSRLVLQGLALTWNCSKGWYELSLWQLAKGWQLAKEALGGSGLINLKVFTCAGMLIRPSGQHAIKKTRVYWWCHISVINTGCIRSWGIKWGCQIGNYMYYKNSAREQLIVRLGITWDYLTWHENDVEYETRALLTTTQSMLFQWVIWLVAGFVSYGLLLSCIK